MSVQINSQIQLLIRTRELSALRGLLTYLDSLPPTQRTQWLGENVDTLTRAFSLFVEMSNRTLNHVNTDMESIKLSSELINGLKETEDLVEKILSQGHQLRS